MALALGWGSLYNHSNKPNVSFSIDTSSESITYTTCRDVEPDEELCIFYGHQLWFDNADAVACDSQIGQGDEDAAASQNPFAEGNQTEVLPEDDLPFSRTNVVPDEDRIIEEDVDSIRKSPCLLPLTLSYSLLY